MAASEGQGYRPLPPMVHATQVELNSQMAIANAMPSASTAADLG